MAAIDPQNIVALPTETLKFVLLSEWLHYGIGENGVQFYYHFGIAL